MTTIGPASILSGELATTEDLQIEGEVHGFVHVREATLTIAPDAVVKADVRGARVIVRGRVDGSIVATERIDHGCYLLRRRSNHRQSVGPRLP